MSDSRTKIRERLGLRPIVNVSGTMTALGASIGLDAVARAMVEALPEFVEIDDLQRKASAAIAKATGAEAGCVTASAAAGMTVVIAGAMTGADPARIEQLPDTSGMKNEVPIMVGHMVHYGAPIEQAIRLAGARPVPIGGATRAQTYQLEAALNERTAAALYVVSHHVVGHGQLPLEDFAAICRRRGVPVIADLASEYDLKGFLARGTDIALYSAHKFLSGPTAGIVAGSKGLVRATYLQNVGIGRGMKVGKETIAGVIAALEAWDKRDHAAVRAHEQRHLDLWIARLKGLPGVIAEIVPDPTDNPLDRVKVRIDPAAARITAWDLADALARGAPPIIVRDHEVEHGFFYLDPCNMHDGEAEVVAERIATELTRARAGNGAPGRSPSERRRARIAGLLRWPD